LVRAGDDERRSAGDGGHRGGRPQSTWRRAKQRLRAGAAAAGLRARAARGVETAIARAPKRSGAEAAARAGRGAEVRAVAPLRKEVGAVHEAGVAHVAHAVSARRWKATRAFGGGGGGTGGGGRTAA